MLLEKSYQKFALLLIFSFLFITDFAQTKDPVLAFRKGKDFQLLKQKDSAALQYKIVLDSEQKNLPDSIRKKLPQLSIKVSEYFLSRNDIKNGAPYVLRAIDLCKKNHDTSHLIRAYNLNTEVQRAINNHHAAKVEIRKAIYLAKLAGKKDKLLYDNMVTLAAIFLDENSRTDSAAYFLTEALPLIRSAKDTVKLGKCYNNLAVSHQRKKDYDKAEFYYRKALELHQIQKNNYGIIRASSNLVQVLLDKRKFKEALSLTLETLNNHETDNPEISGEFHLSKARAYLHLNSPDSAEKYFEKFFEITMQSFDQQQTSYINELNTKYKTEEKEKDIALLTSKSKLQEEESKRKQIIIYAFLVITLFLIVTVYLSIKSYRNKQKANILITEQKKEVEKQKHIVEEKQKEIIDSINYAKRIQNTILANHELLNSAFPEHFVLFLPKDIVSGDFYWATANRARKENESRSDDLFYLAVCDSTGHGVPGAFMSLLNSSYLNEAINEKFLTQPGEILNYVRKRLKENLSKDKQSDGMDCILLCYDKSTEQLTYSAANNKPVVVSSGLLSEYPADKMPVGEGIRQDSFTTKELNSKSGDMIYLYTDGFADQFGGEKGKKYKYKQLNDLLARISTKDLKMQKEILESEFSKWKGEHEQVDDICIVGIRV